MKVSTHRECPYSEIPLRERAASCQYTQECPDTEVPLRDKTIAKIQNLWHIHTMTCHSVTKTITRIQKLWHICHSEIERNKL